MEEVIKKWKLNKRVIADKMGMTVVVFNNKLSKTHNSNFTTQEKYALRNVLLELMKDIDSATDIDFNDALKSMLEIP